MSTGRLLWFSLESGYGVFQPDHGGAPRLVTRTDLGCDTRAGLLVARAGAPPSESAAGPVRAPMPIRLRPALVR